MRVAVIIPTHNNGSYILDAVNSILEQRYEDLRLIVVDDGSSDGTFERLQSVSHPSLINFRLPCHCGQANARNIGIRLAHESEYIAIMDADDIALPNRVSEQVAFLDNNPTIDIVGSQIKIFTDNVDNVVLHPQHPTEDGDIKARLLLLNGTAIIHPTTMIRASFLRKNNLDYPPPVRGIVGIDHDFWISAVPFRVRFKSLPSVLVMKRRHENNVSREHQHKAELRKLKTISRHRLLSAYFPDLTGSDLWHLALLLEEGRKLSFEELALGLASFKKAVNFPKSTYGENKSLIFSFLKRALQQQFTALSSRL